MTCFQFIAKLCKLTYVNCLLSKVCSSDPNDLAFPGVILFLANLNMFLNPGIAGSRLQSLIFCGQDAFNHPI